MKKVIIIGCPGAGKSYFAKKLHSMTGIPLYHLDLIWHKPDKTHISRAEFDETLKRIFQEDAWIMDGDFSRTMEIRMQACDTIILFDIPYEICMQGIREREGTKRDDMPWEVAETDTMLLNEVKSYIPEQLPKVYQLLDKYKRNKEVIIFRTREEAERWLMMGRVFLICGKICSGKTYYAKQLKETYNAVILSTDEVTYDLMDNEQGEFYNEFARRVNRYLMKKAAEIAKAGANVILDWGFWTKENRREISDFLKKQSILYEWHYIDVGDETWQKNIRERNSRILAGNGGSDFYVDDGLLEKVLSKFEVPSGDEIDVRYTVK